jgi:hypothetical protein
MKNLIPVLILSILPAFLVAVGRLKETIRIWLVLKIKSFLFMQRKIWTITAT